MARGVSRQVFLQAVIGSLLAAPAERAAGLGGEGEARGTPTSPAERRTAVPTATNARKRGYSTS